MLSSTTDLNNWKCIEQQINIESFLKDHAILKTEVMHIYFKTRRVVLQLITDAKFK